MKYVKTLSLAALALLVVACKSEDKAGAAQQTKPQVKIAKARTSRKLRPTLQRWRAT